MKRSSRLTLHLIICGFGLNQIEHNKKAGKFLQYYKNIKRKNMLIAIVGRFIVPLIIKYYKIIQYQRMAWYWYPQANRFLKLDQHILSL